MTFQYRDAYGRVLTADHGLDDDDNPMAVLWSRGEFGASVPVRIPSSRVEEVVAGIRDAARTTAGQSAGPLTHTAAADAAAWAIAHEKAAARQTTGQADTDPHTCPDGEPCPGHDTPACSNCDGIDPATCLTHPRPAPAVGQPAEAQAADEARPPRVQWVIEWYREAKGEWLEDQPAYNYRDDAFDEIARQRRHNPTRQLRLVRETTTWTVEDETR